MAYTVFYSTPGGPPGGAGPPRPLQRSKKQKAAYLKRDKRLLAGVEGFEPSARGFGDRCSTN